MIKITYPHKTRQARVDYICRIGGYFNRDGRWPIEFNVAADRCDFDFEHIWEKYSKEFVPEECKDLARQKYEECRDDLWQWGLEEAVRSLHDDDGYRMLRDGTELEVTLELQGRGGKHLVITKFEGRSLCRIEEDLLRHDMMYQYLPSGEGTSEFPTLRKGATWDWSAHEVELLYKYVRQCESDFTPATARAEVEYQGAFQFFANIVEPAWEGEK